MQTINVRFARMRPLHFAGLTLRSLTAITSGSWNLKSVHLKAAVSFLLGVQVEHQVELVDQAPQGGLDWPQLGLELANVGVLSWPRSALTGTRAELICSWMLWSSPSGLNIKMKKKKIKMYFVLLASFECFFRGDLTYLLLIYCHFPFSSSSCELLTVHSRSLTDNAVLFSLASSPGWSISCRSEG